MNKQGYHAWTLVCTLCGRFVSPQKVHNCVLWDGKLSKGEFNWDIGYIVGVLFGDGCILRHSRHMRGKGTIILSVTSRSFVDKFSESMKRVVHKEGHIYSIPVERLTATVKYNSPVIRYVLHSRYWCEKFTAIKQLVMDGKKFKADFCSGVLEGFFDFDGHIGTISNGRGLRYKTIVLTNTNYPLLERMRSFIELLGIQPYKIYKAKLGKGHLGKKDIYRLVVHKKDEVRKLVEVCHVSL